MELRSLTLHYLNHSKKNKMCHHACVCSARTFSFLTYFRNKVSHPHEPACLSALPPPHQSSEPDIPPVAKWERKLLRSGALAQGSIGSWKVARSAGGLYTSLSHPCNLSKCVWVQLLAPTSPSSISACQMSSRHLEHHPQNNHREWET